MRSLSSSHGLPDTPECFTYAVNMFEKLQNGLWTERWRSGLSQAQIRLMQLFWAGSIVRARETTRSQTTNICFRCFEPLWCLFEFVLMNTYRMDSFCYSTTVTGCIFNENSFQILISEQLISGNEICVTVPPRHRGVQKWRIDLWSFLMLRSRFEAVGNKSTDQFLEFERLKFSVHCFFATHARFWYAPLWSARLHSLHFIEAHKHC